MKKSKENGATCVNVEVPNDLVKWMDEVATEQESSRSGIVRISLRKLKEQAESSKKGDQQ